MASPPTASFHDPRIALSHWSELVRPTGVPTPDTVSLPLTESDEGRPQWDTDVALAAVETLGGEAFVRSDYKSASLSHATGSHIQTASPDAVDSTLMELVSQHAMMQLPIGDAIHLREWLDLEWIAYERAPCHPEVRFFVADGEVLCSHLRTDIPDELGDVESTARAFFSRDSDDFPQLTEEVHGYAADVATAVAGEGRYAVDFVLTTDYEWYLTDMALDALYQRDGEWQNISHHPGDCHHDLEQQYADWISSHQE